MYNVVLQIDLTKAQSIIYKPTYTISTRKGPKVWSAVDFLTDTTIHTERLCLHIQDTDYIQTMSTIYRKISTLVILIKTFH